MLVAIFSLIISQAFQVETLADVDDVVWGMEFIDSNRLIFTETRWAARHSKRSLDNSTTLFRAMPAKNTNIHFGCRIVFDRSGVLLLTVGERNNRDEAQVKSNHLGKVLRFKDFKNSPEIVSYGHRNPQGLAIHPETGDIWVNEHGPRGGDEINLIKSGAIDRKA